MSAHLRIDIVDEIQEIATYMQKKFAETMLNIDHPHLWPEVFIPIPEDWSLEYTIEVDLAVAIIAQAFDNQGNRPASQLVYHMTYMRVVESTTWDVERYADRISRRNVGILEDFDQDLQSRFEPLRARNTLEIQPLTVADRHGKMLLWYLPGIFTMLRQIRYSGLSRPMAQVP